MSDGHESAEDGALKAAREKIRQAELDLAKARELEERARNEIEEAKRRIEEVEKAGPRPEVYVFFVSGKEYTTDQRELTGLQIKARVPEWDQTHDLVLEGHGNKPDQVIRDDELVNLHSKHGPLRFSSAPKANFGSNEHR